MKIKLHRKEQWDLKCWPWLCVHVAYNTRTHTYRSTRVFCLWSGGIQIGSWLWCWGTPVTPRDNPANPIELPTRGQS
jgi:hypothetical protein